MVVVKGKLCSVNIQKVQTKNGPSEVYKYQVLSNGGKRVQLIEITDWDGAKRDYTIGKDVEVGCYPPTAWKSKAGTLGVNYDAIGMG